MKLNSITTSIHGELPLIGYPCTIVRLSGCNLKCAYCDTDYSYKFDASPETIANAVNHLAPPSVLITGGEPLLQRKEVHRLCNLIPNKPIVIETNGTIPIDRLETLNPLRPVHYVADYKLGKPDLPFYPNNYFSCSYIKFVFNTTEEFWYALATAKRTYRGHAFPKFIFSPRTPINLLRNEPMAFYVDALVEVSSEIPVAMQVQLHKILEVE